MPRSTVPRRRASTGSEGSRLPLRGSWVAIAAVALVLAGAGATLRAGAATPQEASNVASLGGLTAALDGAGWVSMDGHGMGDQAGYQMPAQMMPGAPVGDDMRLGIPVTLTNTSDDVQRFNLVEEFSLVGGRNSEPRRLHSDTFGDLSRLTPGSAVDGVLYFDTIVPGSEDRPLYLKWERDGDAEWLAVRVGGDAPDHGHGSSGH